MYIKQNNPLRFLGEHCEHEVNPCEHSPCVNGGLCSEISRQMLNTSDAGMRNASSNYMCECVPGFSGALCEVESCVEHLCHNGAVCIGGGKSGSV